MAKYIECMRADGHGFVALQVDRIEAVHPQFNKAEEFTSSRVYMSYGGMFDVNETWEQLVDAIGADDFSACTRPFVSLDKPRGTAAA